MRYGLILLAAVLCVAPASALQYEAPADTLFPSLDIHVAAEVPQFIRQQCLAAVRQESDNLRRTLWPFSLPPAPITVYLETTEGFRARMKGIPDWGVGAAWNDEAVIDCQRSLGIGRSVTHVLLHELAHCLIQQGAGGHDATVPRWFHEGVAQRVSGEWRFRDTVSLLLEGGMPDLRRLSRAFPSDAGRADQAYRASLLAIMVIERRYGEDAVPRILQETAWRGFTAAFVHVTGENLETFSASFRDSVTLRYGWALMLTRWPAMFVLLALIFLIGAAAKLIRSRRRMAEMDLEYGPPRPEPDQNSHLWQAPSDRE